MDCFGKGERKLGQLRVAFPALSVLYRHPDDNSAVYGADHGRPPRAADITAHWLNLVVNKNNSVSPHFGCVASESFLDFLDLGRRINRGIHDNLAQLFVWPGGFTAEYFYLGR